MKNISIAYILGILLLFSGCVRVDELNLNIVEGMPATVALNLGVESITVETRAGTDEESRVYDIVIFIFDSKGKRVSSINVFNEENPGLEVDKSLTVKTFTGEGMTVYAVANVRSGIMETSVDELLNVRTLSDLSGLVATLSQKTIARGRGLLMSGTVSDTDATEPKKINITEGGDIQHTIRLRRIDAKVTFKIKTQKIASLINAGAQQASNARFIPDKWRVLNCGTKVKIIHDHNDQNINGKFDHFKSPLAIYERDVDPYAASGTSVDDLKFTFYILQSLLDKKKEIPTSADDGTLLSENQRYSLRTKKGTGSLSGDFEYANTYSPYVELSGTLIYDLKDVKEGNKLINPRSISANVTYQVMLGYKDNEPDDYQTLCNTEYTYNVTLISAENIRVEATTNEERQSGATGDVVQTTKLYEFDAHYETGVITFNALNTTYGLGWYVWTPYTSGKAKYYPYDDEPVISDDYKWIYFRLNDLGSDNRYVKTFAKYPGEQEGNIYTYGLINKVPGGGAGSNEVKKYNTALLNDYTAELRSNPNLLIDIHHLARILSASNATTTAINGQTPLFDNNQEITFTAFVNEYFYDETPTGGATDPASLWKSFANNRSRTIGLATKSITSADGASVYADVVTEFAQKSIQTVYSTDKSNTSLENAWGTESVDNTGRLNYYKNYRFITTSTSDGHSNTIARWGIPATNSSVLWNTYVNSIDNSLRGTTKDPDEREDVNILTHDIANNYNRPEYACMLRNRDNNGDGKIDRDEVRWYLAAIEQLSDLWIGENSLHVDSRLYRYRRVANDPDKMSLKAGAWGEEIYISSSRFGTAANYYANLWAGEGSSEGQTKWETWMPVTRFYYKCLRNFGDGTPGNVVTVKKTENLDERGNNTYIIDLKNLNKSSIRNYKAPELLQDHTERSLDNLPYYSFEVASAISMGGGNWATVTAREATDPKCPKGWRPPNQRELSLMTRLPFVQDEWHVGSFSFASSSFSFSPLNNGTASRPAFAANALTTKPKLLLLKQGDTGFSVRCVRDVTTP